MPTQPSTRKSYPSDISREEFEVIRLDLEGHKKRTRPRKHDLYEVFCALLYLLKSGCQWDMIPRDYPAYQVVYYYYAQWKERKGDQPSLLEQCLKKICWRGPKRPWQERADHLLYP
jgi:transposase